MPDLLKNKKATTLHSSAKKKFITFGSRETCLIRDEPWFTWLARNGVEFIDLPNGRIYDYYVSEKDYHQALEKLRIKMARNWSQHLIKYHKKKRAVIKTACDLRLSVKSGNRSGILDRHNKYFQAAYDFNEYMWGAWAVIYRVEPDVMQEIPEEIGLIAKLDQPINFMKMQRDVFCLPANKWLQEYQWLKMYNPYDPVYTKKDYLKFRKTLKRSELKKQFKELAKTKTDFDKLIRQIKNRSLKQKMLMIHVYAWLKTDRIDVWRKSIFELRDFYQYLAQELPGASLRDACNLSCQEIRELLNKKRAVSAKELKKRSKNSALYYAQGNRLSILYSNEKIRKITKQLTTQAYSENITGVCASPGWAVGKVSIISHSSDLRKVKNGDVFVAKYTFPTYLPAMAKCSAIVTDDGGMTSHAAIVARELKIPCVVGTKNATRLLKDKDRVEVKATKGLVKKR